MTGTTGSRAAAAASSPAGRVDAGLPSHLATHKSGGRDRWSEPLTALPRDPSAAVRDALNEVLDPEIPISLVELGLVYNVDWDDGVARVSLGYTATACPCMEFIREDVTDRLRREPWIDRVDLMDVWSPPWTTDRITPEGRAKLRHLGVSA